VDAGRSARKAFLVIALAAAVAACGGNGPTGDQSRSPTASPTGTGSVAAALLPAADMPAWNGAITWIADAQPELGLLGLCRLPDLADVAQQGLRATRTYSAGPMQGLNSVTVLADADAASRAVVDHTAALSRCAPGPTGPTEPPRARSAKVADLPNGSTWLVSAPAGGDDTRFEFVGVARQGRVVTIVGLELVAQDANAEGDPVAASVAESIERIHRSLPEAAQATPTATASPAERAVPVYYVVGWGTDLRLVRESHRTPVWPGAQALAVEAVTQMLSSAADDPDYGSLWDPSTRVLAVGRADGVVTVDLSEEARAVAASDQAAQATAQQLVHTVTAALGVDDPVRLLVAGLPAGLIWDTVDWSAPIPRAPELDIRMLVEIESPSEGSALERTFTVTGLAAADEAILDWRLVATGGEVVASGRARTAEAGRMAPFRFEVTLPAMASAGQYRIIVAQADVPGGSAEPGPMSDDKQVNVG
jgi:hypothetical protein